MIVRAVTVPHPPLLVPELVGNAVSETAPLRTACQAVTSELTAVAADWIAVGADRSGPTEIPPDAIGTFRGYGADVRVSLSADSPPHGADPLLPLPALVAGWLRGQAGAHRVRVRLVRPDTAPEDCRALGAELAAAHAGPAPVGLLVLADGANRHGDKSPGWRDDRSGPFDDAVAAALAAADASALLTLDPALAGELNANGRAPWQVLAGLALATGDWRGRLVYSDHPYGVAYHVAVWEPESSKDSAS